MPYPIVSVGVLIVAASLTGGRYCGLLREDVMIFPSLAICSTRVRVTLGGTTHVAEQSWDEMFNPFFEFGVEAETTAKGSTND